MKEWNPSFPWYVRGTFFGGMEDVEDDAAMEPARESQAALRNSSAPPKLRPRSRLHWPKTSKMDLNDSILHIDGVAVGALIGRLGNAYQ